MANSIQTGEDLGRLQALFEEVLRRPEHEREAFLAEACKDDKPMRLRLQRILAAHAQGDLTLDRPSPGLGTADAASPTRTIPSRPAHRDPDHIGPYRILERLGEGGMGVVYKAEQKHPVRRLVALKVIKLGMDTKEVIARFEAERQALAMMNHPNIAKVYEAGITDQGRPYFAMEHVAGVPFIRYCDESRLTTRERLELFIQICQAIQHAHQKGIIHRDLKPTNILVTHFDGKPVPKVIDFGIAKAANQALTDRTLYTRTGSLIGTPEYMSPEQALTSGLDVDTRTDVYSLGVILYELLTGTLPFDPKALQKQSLEQMAHIIKTVEPQRPSTRLSSLGASAATSIVATDGPDFIRKTTGGTTLAEVASLRRCDPKALQRDLRGDLDWIVLKAMEKDRTRRYETANALATDVCRHLENEPVTARPPSAAYRFSKLARRHKGAFAAALAMLLILLLGTAGTGIGMMRARDQRDQAIAARQSAEAAMERVKQANQLMFDTSRYYATDAYQRHLKTMVERLDAGWLANEPEIEAVFRQSLGNGYKDLTDYPAAERQLNIALELGRLALGENSVQYGDMHRNLATVHKAQHNYKAAESHYRKAIEILRRSELHAKGITGVPETLNSLADLYEKMGDIVASEKMRVEAIEEFIAYDTRIIEDLNINVIYRARMHNFRGEERATLGRFAEAQPDFARAIELDPKEHKHWCNSAIIRLYLGDEEGYRRDRRGMYERFKDTASPSAARWIIRVCAMQEGVEEFDLKPLLAVVDRDIEEGNSESVSSPYLSKGLHAYRTGKYEQAIEFLKNAKTMDSLTGKVLVDLTAAMAHHRLGQTAQAESLMAHTVELFESRIPKAGVGRLGVKGGVEKWLSAHILRREAEALILRKPPEATTK